MQRCASPLPPPLTPTCHLSRYASDLSQYTYESPSDVTAREAAIASRLAKLLELAEAKLRFLQDHLARNRFQDDVRLWVRGHQDSHTSIVAWVDGRRRYLQTKETIDSINEAQLQLSLLRAYGQEKEDKSQGSVVALKAAGSEIREAEYKTEISQWKYEKPEEVEALEAEIEGPLWAELTTLSDEKQRVLADDLAREQFKEKVRLWVKNHEEMFSLLELWSLEKIRYLEVKETISNSEEAKEQLSRLALFEQKKSDLTAADVAGHSKLGAEIRAAVYETEYSRWVYPAPAEVSALEGKVVTHWETMAAKSASKQLVLEDDLARELYAEATRLLADQHGREAGRVMAWAALQDAYLKLREECDTEPQGEYLLSVFDAYVTAKATTTSTTVSSLKSLGATVLARKYETSYSSYVYEKPEDVTAREVKLNPSLFTSINLGLH